MSPRATLIAVLVVLELAIVGGIGMAVRPNPVAPWFAAGRGPAAAAGPHLIEGGAHQYFDAGARPALIVDIGYADLTILTRAAGPIDVSVSKSSDFGLMRSTLPITARRDGDAVRVATVGSQDWSIGDDRMVTAIVPPETRVTVLDAGDITANGLRATASFNSSNGLITLADYTAPALHIATSMNGRVVGSALHVNDGRIETASGNITLDFAPDADTQVTAQTTGAIRVAGFAQPAADEAESGAGQDDDDDAPSSRTVRLGSGSGRLDVHSSSGNIALRRDI